VRVGADWVGTMASSECVKMFGILSQKILTLVHFPN